MSLNFPIFQYNFYSVEDNKVPKPKYNNIVISLLFTVAYFVLLGIYNEISILSFNNQLLASFMVSSFALNALAIFFAWKDYRKISSIILIIINSLGLLLIMVLLLLISS